MTTAANLTDPIRPYKLVQNSDGAQAVMLTGKPFKNYIIRFGKVVLNETTEESDGDTLLKLDYDYEVLRGKEPTRDPRRTDFVEYMGNVLMDLILKGIREHSLPLSTDTSEETANE